MSAEDWRLVADDDEVWRGPVRPGREIVRTVANRIEETGWNGTTMDLYQGDSWVALVDAMDTDSL